MNTYDSISLLDPRRFAERVVSLSLDPWQKQALAPFHRRLILNCSRQSGKSTLAALQAVHHILTHPQAQVLVLSGSETQAGEVTEKIRAFLNQLGEPTRSLKGRKYDFQSHTAKVRALPCRESAVRGYTCTFAVLDEAALIPDAVFHALTGTLASTWHKAQIWILSTPRHCSGFYYDFWHAPQPGWLYLRATAHDCPRISPAFLEERRRSLPPSLFAQEYLCEFGHAHDAAFSASDLTLALTQDPAPAASPNILPLLGRHPEPAFYLGLDLAQLLDHTSLSLLEWRASPTASQLHVRWLQRFPTGVDYTELLRALRHFLTYPELRAARRIELVYDRTGIGTVFHDFLRSAQLGVRLSPIVITGGHQATSPATGGFHVPKHELIGHTQFAFRRNLLRIAPDCPGLPALREEMLQFRRIESPHGQPIFTGRAGHPDDMIMSLSLAVWRAFQIHKHSLLQ